MFLLFWLRYQSAFVAVCFKVVLESLSNHDEDVIQQPRLVRIEKTMPSVLSTQVP